MSKENDFVKTYDIDGIDSKYLKYVTITDLYDTAEERWYIKDNYGNTTPIFTNSREIIKINEKSCLFLGQSTGETKLYVASGSDEKKDCFYNEIKLDSNPKELININLKYLLIKSIEGMYFFDKEELKRSSDIFDKISLEYVDGREFFSFEKTIKDDELSKSIIGTVTPNGNIGYMVYDNTVNGLKSTPKTRKDNNYDELDYVFLYKELEKQKELFRISKRSNIKKLSILNRNN